MTIQTVDVGALPNDGTGDALRLAFQKINSNFSEFATVSFTGAYTSLVDKPVLATVAVTGNYTDLQNIPFLGSLAALSSINNTNWGGTPLSIQNGGTGCINAAEAFAALSPLTTAGDLLYVNPIGQHSRLAIGANGKQLTVVSNMPQWQAPVLPGTPYGTIQYNSNGSFTGANSLVYSLTGTCLTIQTSTAADVPLNLAAASGQTGHMLDLSSNSGTADLAFFAANGGLWIQGSPLTANSIELNNKTVAARIFNCKLANGAFGPYLQANGEAIVEVYSANGTSLQSLGFGNNVILAADADGEMHQRNDVKPQNFKCHNKWYNDSNWERGGIDWKSVVNVCRFGTEYSGNGVARNLHFHTGGVDCLRIDAFQNIVCGNGGLITSSTSGHTYIPSVAGIPTGVPTNFNNMCAHVVDRTNNRLYVYVNGAWKYASLT